MMYDSMDIYHSHYLSLAETDGIYTLLTNHESMATLQT